MKKIDDLILELAQNGRVELDPINIAMVAPTGVGKTSLLCTFVEYMNSIMGSGSDEDVTFNIKPCSDKDTVALNVFKKEFEKFKLQKKIKNIALVPGSKTSTKYEFQLDVESDNGKKITQRFCVLDIPGVLLSDEKTGSSSDAQYRDFETHLLNSPIVWVPVDARYLMECNDAIDFQCDAGIEHRSTHNIKTVLEKWIKKWNNTDMPNSYIFFTPIKCETYYSQDKTGELNLLCLKKFREYYGDIIDMIKENSPHKTTIHYNPVETIGCIKIIDNTWEKDGIVSEYKFVLDDEGLIRRKISGMFEMLSSVFYCIQTNIRGTLQFIEDINNKTIIDFDSIIAKNHDIIDNAGFWSKFINVFDGHLDNIQTKIDDAVSQKEEKTIDPALIKELFGKLSALNKEMERIQKLDKSKYSQNL